MRHVLRKKDTSCAQDIHDALIPHLPCHSFIDITTALAVTLPGSNHVIMNVPGTFEIEALDSPPHRVEAVSDN